MPIDWKLEGEGWRTLDPTRRHLLVMPIDWKHSSFYSIVYFNQLCRHLLVMPIDWKLCLGAYTLKC